jgi:hypothetical protein
MSRSWWPLACLVTLACVAGPGCGGDEDPTTTAAPPRDVTLSSAERARAARSVAAIRAYCRRVARYASGRAGPPSLSATRRTVDAARGIASLARRKPDAQYRGSQRARDLAGDLAEDLEGTNCSARLVAELARGLP